MWRCVVFLVPAIAVLAMTLSGCGPMFESEYTGPAEGDYGYGTPTELGELLVRRDAEDVIAQRDRMIDEITTEIARIVPGSRWLPDSEPHSTGCGDFGSTDGSSYFSPHYTSQVPVPAALWEEASEAVVTIATRYGYTHVSRTENATDDQAANITITDDESGRLTLTSMDAASMYVGTGCYLTAEDKRKARDAAPAN